MTTSFSSAVEPGGAQQNDAAAAGNDGVLVLDAAQHCLSADAAFAHIFDIDSAGLTGRALTETPLPKPLAAALAEARNLRYWCAGWCDHSNTRPNDEP